MNVAFLILVVLHGITHLLGWIKGFEWSEVKELTLPISKPMGVMWLTTGILFLTYAVARVLNYNYDWLIGLFAVLLSQVLIILFWKDAKFGTIPNLIILAVSIVSFGYYNFQKIIQHETAALFAKNVNVENRTFNERDIGRLPEPVKKWLINSGAMGKPFIHCGKVTQSAEMQIKPEQDHWLRATAIQYTTIDHPAFLWSVEVKMNPLLNLHGRDKYDDGKGEMLIKLYSLFNLVNERGARIDEGTLQRFLGEMVWFPSLALSPYITWEKIDPNTAKATMAYKGTSGSGTFYFNSSGDVIKFSALRYKGNEANAKRYYWAMNILGYKTFEGIKVPATMTSTWKLDDKDWTWLKMEVTDLKYNNKVSHK